MKHFHNETIFIGKANDFLVSYWDGLCNCRLKLDLKEVCISPTALIVKFLTKRFISEYDPNLGEFLSVCYFIFHGEFILLYLTIV